MKKQHRALLAAILVLAAFSLSAEAKAIDPESLFGASPETLLAAAAEAQGRFSPAEAEAAGVVYLYDCDRYEFDERGALRHLVRSAYKIISREGAENWAEVSAWYEPWHEERPSIKARVIAADGTVSTPPESTFADQGAASRGDSVYSDSRRYAVPLPNLLPGSVVELEVITADRDPVLARTASFRSWFGSEAPIASRRLVVDYPASLSLRYAPRGEVPEPAKASAGQRLSLSFSAEDIAGTRDFEHYVPRDAVPLSYVEFGVGDSWKAVAAAYAAVVEPLLAADDVGPWAREALAGLPAGTDPKGDAAIAAVLLRLRKEVRYTGVNFGENAVIPHKPSDTIARGYGDCKDQASLLVAALRSLGLEARLALLNAGGDLDPRPETPGIGLFDHCIAYLPKRGLWLDPTALYYPGFSLPAADEGRLALVIGPDAGGLLATSDSGSAGATISELREYKLAPSGAASVLETSTFSGGLEAYYKRNFAGADEKKVREQLERYVKSAYDAKKLESCSVEAASSHDEPFKLTIAASGCGLAETEYSYARAVLKTGGLVDFLPDELTASKDTKAAKARKGDLFLSMPYRSEYRFRLVPPAGFEAMPLPKGLSKDLGAAHFSSSFSLEGDGSVTALYRFDSGKRRLSPAEAASTREAIRAFLDGDADVVVFRNRGEALLEGGDYLGALREFEGLAAASPGDSGCRVRISRALLSAGFASEALAEAKKAVELDPKSADARQNLAYALLFDPYGRMFKTGCDIEAAKAEYRKAAELDPGNDENRYNLAILSEYGVDLARYGKGAKLEEAIDLYRAIKREAGADAGKGSRANNLPVALFRLGRYAEALAEVGETPGDRGARALRAACLAVLEGPEAAIADSGRIEPRVDERREILHQAGSLLLLVRRYPESSALLAASAKAAGAEGQASATEFASMVGRVTKSDAAPDSGKPQGYVESFLDALIAPETPISGLAAFLSASERKRLAEPDSLAEFEAGLQGLRDRFSAVGLPSAVFFDFMRSLGESVVLSEGPAYVLSWSVPSDDSVPSLVLFLEKGEAGFDIVAASGDLADVARNALALLQAGRTEEARSWFLLLKRLDGSDSRLPDLSSFSFLSGLEPASAGADELKKAAGLILCSSSEPADSKAGSDIVYPLWKASADEEWRKARAAELALGLLRAGDSGRGLEVASYLYEKSPKELRSAEIYGLALEASGRAKEGDDIARAGIAKGGSSVGDWKRLLARRLAGRGDYDEALELLTSLFPAGQASKSDYNNVAWYSLYTKAGLPSSFVDRYAIVKRLSGGGDAELHTLVCFLAAEGRLSEARELFERYVNIPAKSDALVCERLAYAFLAEAFGLEDCARSYYGGALKKDAFYPGLSVGALAERRLSNIK